METGYCVRCKTTHSIVNPVKFVTKNRREALRGKCITCGGNVVKILGKIVPVT